MGGRIFPGEPFLEEGEWGGNTPSSLPYSLTRLSIFETLHYF